MVVKGLFAVDSPRWRSYVHLRYDMLVLPSSLVSCFYRSTDEAFESIREIMTEPHHGVGAVSKLADHVVARIEGVSNIHRIELLSDVTRKPLFFNWRSGVRRLCADSLWRVN